MAGEQGAPPGRLDVLGADAGVFEGLEGRVDDHVLETLAPVLAELDASHPDDGHLVFDALHGHSSGPDGSHLTGWHFHQ